MYKLLEWGSNKDMNSSTSYCCIANDYNSMPNCSMHSTQHFAYILCMGGHNSLDDSKKKKNQQTTIFPA